MNIGTVARSYIAAVSAMALLGLLAPHAAAQPPAAEAPAQAENPVRQGRDNEPAPVVWGVGKELQAGVALINRYGRPDQRTGLYVFGVYVRNVTKRTIEFSCPSFDGLTVPWDQVDYTTLMQSRKVYCSPRIVGVAGKLVDLQLRQGEERIRYSLKPGQSAMVSHWMLRTMPRSSKGPNTKDYSLVAFVEPGKYRVSCDVKAEWGPLAGERLSLRSGIAVFDVTAEDLKGN